MESTLSISLKRETKVFFQKSLLKKNSSLYFPKENLIVISDKHLKEYYEKDFKGFFPQSTHYFFIEPGEKNKSFSQFEKLLKDLFKKGADKTTTIVAIGGGVVLDLVGFLTSSFLRGVDFISIPTSFLAMVDASIGGKTAVNMPYGKNLVGSYYSAKSIFVDTTFLETLPKNQLRSGLIEGIKHALIYDRELFFDLLENYKKIARLDLEYIEEIVIPCMQIKMEVIKKDPFEKEFRKILNFGHTIGHAIEFAENYEGLHGEAISIGILAESYLSYKKGILPQTVFEKIKESFSLFECSFKLKKTFSEEKFFQALYHDKKNRGKKVYMVLLQDIGKYFEENNKVAFPIDSEELEIVYLWMRERFSC